MKLSKNILAISALALVAIPALQAAPVILNVDSSFEGLASEFENPLGFGTYQVGWLNPGVTQPQIVGFFTAGNLAAIDAAFNTVSVFNFTPTSPETVEPNLSLGLVFKSIELVADGDATGLAAYKNPTTGAAGKQAFLYIRTPGDTEIAFIDSGFIFNNANDVIGNTDFNTDLATASDIITPANVWVGSLAPVTFGSGVDINGGSPADGRGFYEGTSVIKTATVVPEPSTALALLGGMGLVALRRRRA
jgi:hypothetical protein